MAAVQYDDCDDRAVLDSCGFVRNNVAGKSSSRQIGYSVNSVNPLLCIFFTPPKAQPDSTSNLQLTKERSASARNRFMKAHGGKKQ